MDDIQLDKKRRILHHYRKATKSHLAANVGNLGRRGTDAVPTRALYFGYPKVFPSVVLRNGITCVNCEMFAVVAVAMAVAAAVKNNYKIRGTLGDGGVPLCAEIRPS